MFGVDQRRYLSQRKSLFLYFEKLAQLKIQSFLIENPFEEAGVYVIANVIFQKRENLNKLMG